MLSPGRVVFRSGDNERMSCSMRSVLNFTVVLALVIVPGGSAESDATESTGPLLTLSGCEEERACEEERG
jgi:hypothetical protein